MVTYIIIAITVIASILAFQDTTLFNKYLFNPYRLHRNKSEWYRFFTHALIHVDWMHLFFNMFVLYSFGVILEKSFFTTLFGSKAEFYYVMLYVGGVMVSSIPGFEKHKNDSFYNAVGASGAVSAVVFSCIFIAPTQSLYILFLPFPIPGVVFGVLYLLYSWYMGKRGTDNIGHDAHFWGAMFGIVFTILLKPSLVISFFQQIAHML